MAIFVQENGGKLVEVSKSLPVRVMISADSMGSNPDVWACSCKSDGTDRSCTAKARPIPKPAVNPNNREAYLKAQLRKLRGDVEPAWKLTLKGEAARQAAGRELIEKIRRGEVSA